MLRISDIARGSGYEEFDVFVEPCVRVRAAAPMTEALHRLGLQGFAPPGPGEGMLFLSARFPDDDEIGMWMASVPFPLCMAWISADGRVSRMLDGVRPGDARIYRATGIACLETAAGVLRGAGVREGSRACLSRAAPSAVIS